MPADARPLAQSERVELFDVLRGFALLGILVVNFWGQPGTFMPAIDARVSDLIGALADSSFYPLYSFLFGIGFAVQLERARTRGSGTTHLYLRRMLVLFLIGTVHAIFIWEGDILVTYALTGLLLIPLHRLPQKALLTLVLLLIVVNLNSNTVRAGIDNWRYASASVPEQRRNAAEAEESRIILNHRMLASGAAAGYGPVTVGRWKWYAENIRKWTDPLTFLLRDVLMFFLIGLLIGRARLLHDAAAHRRALGIAAAIGLLALVSGNVLTQVISIDGGMLSRAIVYAGDLGATTFYVAGIALLFTGVARARRVLSVFAAPGRMGLTNYLMQSIAMTLLVMPYGLGWHLPTTARLVLNLCFFFGVQVTVSRWWLARFQYGPAEWLWRSLTYGARQPLRIRHAVISSRFDVAST